MKSHPKKTQHPRPHDRWSKLRRLFGPGLVTGASDDDPSGIATYSQAGAGFGFSTLWTALLTLPLMITVQEMCARIGLVTRKGLTAVIRLYYPKPVLWLIVLVSFPAIILNIGANLAGMGAVAHMLVPGIPGPVFNILFGISITYLTIALPYRRIANILRWLCLSLLCYLIVPFLTTTDWLQVFWHSLIPEIRWDKDFIMIIVALLGTTISPYLFFWQTSMEVEEVKVRRLVVDKRVLDDMQQDVRGGMFFSNLVAFFIILTTGSVMFPAGVRQISTVQDAAQALRPLAGDMSYMLFSVGVIGTGLLSIPVLAGAMSYMVSEAFGWKEGLNKKFHEAKGFYGVMILSILSALLINMSGLSPMRALILTAVVYGVMAPVVIAIILHICNNRLIMGDRVNGRWTNIFGWLALILMSAAAIVLLYFTFADMARV
jgi:NRAMP (natural resistance-associated macrophage protein)-like metal ion transporter